VADDVRCIQCGSLLAGAGSVEGLCSGCLLSLGLRGPGPGDESGPEARRDTEGNVQQRARRRRGLLRPVGSGIAAPTWAMPVELLRQASRRLGLASFVIAVIFAGAIIVNNLMAASGRLDYWFDFSYIAVQNVVHGTIVAISGAMAWMARMGRLNLKSLLRVSLGYEVLVAFGISLGDNLRPLPSELPMVPLIAVSWLCVWIVSFPLVVPAPPRWALLAGLLSASTWPLGYSIGLALGNEPAPAPVAAASFLEGYIAVGFAMFTTGVMRRLQEMGCYQLVEKLDSGGMGEIWRARHHMLARPVAIKLIRPELLGVRNQAEADALVGRFKREAEATAGLHSPHTVALHDFGVTPEGVFYYVMELLEGLDLESLVRRHGPVPPERAIYLLSQVCESLADAHAAGLIHRDIKPANILACHWGLKWDFVKVLDFGLVKARWSLGSDEQITTEGVVAGTPAYMAPEAALGGRALDARVDLYGVGCVAYWLLTGDRVFAGRTPMELILNHVKTPPVPPSERVSWPIPESLEKLVLQCLAKDPEERPESAEWLGDRLAECRVSPRWTPRRAREWWDRYGVAEAPSRRERDRPTPTPYTPLEPPPSP
jgi:serine/threonine protein kinase